MIERVSRPATRAWRTAQPLDAEASPFEPILHDPKVAGFVVRRDVGRGELLFVQGEEAAGLWLVERGRVRLYEADAEGHEQTLEIGGPGQSFNAVPFFDRGAQPASAAAIEPSTLLVVPQSRRDALLQAVPEMTALAAERLAARLRQAVSLIADLSFRQVSGRVALVLLQAAEPHPGVGAGSGGRPVTQREIAEMAGTSREVVARALRRLEREGLIEIERGRIRLLDREGLARHA